MADGRHFEKKPKKLPYLSKGMTDQHEILQNDVEPQT